MRAWVLILLLIFLPWPARASAPPIQVLVYPPSQQLQVGHLFTFEVAEVHDPQITGTATLTAWVDPELVYTSINAKDFDWCRIAFNVATCGITLHPYQSNIIIGIGRVGPTALCHPLHVGGAVQLNGSNDVIAQTLTFPAPCWKRTFFPVVAFSHAGGLP